MKDFVNLHTHTTYSIMDSLIKPSELFQKTRELGQSAVGVCDHGSLAGAWDCLLASKEAGVKLIMGCEFYFLDDIVEAEHNAVLNGHVSTQLRHLILLAKNAEGYRNLLTLNKLGYEHASVMFKRVIPRIDWKMLERYNQGLICNTACGGGILAQLINTRKLDEAKIQAKKLKDLFGNSLALEIQPHTMKRVANLYKDYEDQKFTNYQLIKLGNELDIKVIVATDAHYLHSADHAAHDCLLAIGSGQPIFSGNRLKYSADFHVKSREEIVNSLTTILGGFKNRAEEFCDNTLFFSEMCEDPEWIDPKFHRAPNVHWELPIFPVHNQPDYTIFKEWYQTKALSSHEDDAYLRYVCETQFDKSFPTLSEFDRKIYQDRVEKELDILEYKNLSSYMLIVADYVNWAKKEGIPVGPGRGCHKYNTKILTNIGFKDICNVSTTDKVYTHTGILKNVLLTHKYDISNEKCLSIKTNHSFGSISLTKDHKVFAVKTSETEQYQRMVKNGAKSLKKIKRFNDLSNPSWILASELKKNDYVYTIFPKRNVLSFFEDIDLSKYCSNTENFTEDSINYQGTKIPRFIKFDKDFVYFIGRWVGDGWISGRENTYHVAICFNTDDVDGIERFQKYFNKLGLSPYLSYQKGKNVVQLGFNNKVIFNYLNLLFPEYKRTSDTKYFPSFFRELSDDLLISLLQGYIDSDGSIDFGKKGTRECIDTVSVRLLLEMKESLLFLKIPSSVAFRKSFYSGKWLCKPSYKLRFNGIYTKNIYQNSTGYFSKILSIEEESLDKVYDITVEDDHSYLTTNFVSHNSVAGSLVAYELGIHTADSIKYGLIFERFYSKLKQGASDIDLDFSQSGKPRVEEYISSKYGKDNCAKVTNYMMLTPKPYAKSIARIFQYGGDAKAAVAVGNAIAESIPKDIKTVKEALKSAPLFMEYANSDKYHELAKYAEHIGNKISARSTHAAAVIICGKPLHSIVPVRKDKDGVWSVEYEKERAEANGLIKMDILGLSTLDIIDDTLKLIKERNKPLPTTEWNYDDNDSKTYELISKGDTYGIFQFGTSAGTIDLCKRMQPKCMEDLAAITALTRPGVPKEFRNQFLEAKFANKKVELLHPCLERSLQSTYGIPVFDECMLTLGEDVAGWDLNESDRLRKFIKDKGKHPDKDEKLKKDFIASTSIHLQDPEIAKKLWEEMFANFNAYLFNKAHAITYSFISYQTAYLKAHYPLEFLTANLTFESNSTSLDAEDNVIRAKNEIRKLKINIIPPDINKSDFTYKIVDDNKIMTGLDSLKYLGKDAIPEILAKRPFKSFEDFLSRVDSKKVRAPAIQALAASGCLDSFGMSRKQMFLYAADYKKKLQVWLKKKNRGENFSYPWPADKEDWSVAQKYALERYYIGEGLSGNKFQAYPGFFNSTASKFASYPILFPDPGASDEHCDIPPFQAEILGFFEFKVKKENSKSFGKPMAKVMLQDPYGTTITMTVFPKQWSELKTRIKILTGGAVSEFVPGIGIYARGSLNWYEGDISIIFEDILKCVPPPPLPSDLKSKKISMRISRSRKSSEELDKEELLEQIEDELIEDGMEDLGELEEDEFEFADIDEIEKSELREMFGYDFK